MKITSTVITIEVEQEQTAPKAKTSVVAPVSKSQVSPSSAKVVLLSGFRDANLEHRATLQGWEINGNFSKAVTLVVVKALGKETEKTRKMESRSSPGKILKDSSTKTV